MQDLPLILLHRMGFTPKYEHGLSLKGNRWDSCGPLFHCTPPPKHTHLFTFLYSCKYLHQLMHSLMPTTPQGHQNIGYGTLALPLGGLRELVISDLEKALHPPRNKVQGSDKHSMWERWAPKDMKC